MYVNVKPCCLQMFKNNRYIPETKRKKMLVNNYNSTIYKFKRKRSFLNRKLTIGASNINPEAKPNDTYHHVK